ncbi:hepatic lectin-like [Lissotriton helveticus]
MQSDVAREVLQDDDFRLFSDKKHFPSKVRLVHVICALLAVSYMLIVVLFVTSSTSARKPPQQENSNDTSMVLAALQGNVQTSADGQGTIGVQMTALQNKIDTLLLKMTDLENTIKKDFPANPCGAGPEAWEYYNGSCYLFLNVKSTWMNGKLKCESKSAILAIITSEGEQSFLAGKTRDQRYWIGLTDMDKEQEWQWIDGTDYKSSIKFWKPNEPNDSNRNEDCAHLLEGGEWNDVRCTDKCFPICEKKVGT